MKPCRALTNLLLVLIAIVATTRPALSQVASVVATGETEPVASSGDAADDAALWIHPTDRDQSTVIGTDKQLGLAVYALDGSEIQFLADGRLNNVDISYDFPLAGEKVALVTAGNRTTDTLAVYAVDPLTRQLTSVVAQPISLSSVRSYGACMYRSPSTGKFYFFGNSKAGLVGQWELFDNGSGQVNATLVRSFDVGSQTEGCVTDGDQAYLFVGEEAVGIWRYGAEPDDDETRIQVDVTGPAGQLTADVEGLALYEASGGAGYLIASSQGNSTYIVYDRQPPHAHVMTFEIVSSPTIDAVSGTDGISVLNFSLGSAFPNGVFIAQDDSNSAANQNFKLIPWEDIAGSVVPSLLIDTEFDPRRLAPAAPETPAISRWGLLALMAVLLAAGQHLSRD